MIHEVAVIGAGPAGIACAIQLKRSGIHPIVFEKNRIGGMLYEANLVENYPGFPNGLPGNELANLMKVQFESEFVETVCEAVNNVGFSKGLFEIKFSSGSVFSKILVVSTGTKPKLLRGIKGNRDLISYDTEMIHDQKKKTMAIIGAGDLAFDYALRFGRFNSIFLLNRSAKVRCIELLRRRSENLSEFNYFEQIKVNGVTKENNGKIILDCVHNGKVIFLEVDYVIGAIGREQNVEFFSDKAAAKMKVLKQDRRLFIIGDAANGKYRQSSIAAGEGVKTAMIIRSKILKTEWK
mgnify:CR=1 FL=1